MHVLWVTNNRFLKTNHLCCFNGKLRMIHAPLLLFSSLTLERWGVPWLWLNFGEWKGAAHVRGTPQWLWVSRFGCQPQRKQVKRDRRGLGNFHQICYTWRGCLQGDWPAAFPKWMHSFEVVLVLFLFRPTWYVFITLIHWSTTTNSQKNKLHSQDVHVHANLCCSASYGL